VSEAELEEWSTLLEGDPDFLDLLPLGDAGGIVGKVRNATSGDPVAGAFVRPLSNDVINNDSNAVIRYLADDGLSFTEDGTGTSGVFVVVSPGLGENFGAEVDGSLVHVNPGTGGSASGAVFSLLLDADV
jgi:hypothetical protein